MTSATNRKTRDSSTLRRRAAVVAATLCTAALTLAAAGCGGSSGTGVARIGSTTSKPTARGASPAGDAANPLAYSRCMRSHGVSNFPDPDSQGRILITSGVSNGKKTGVDVNSPQFKTAQKACQALQPGGGKPVGAGQASKAALKFAQCMRAHGVPSFPDPEPGKPITLGKKAGVDVNSPAFKSAEQTCQKLVPDSPLGGGPAKAPGTP